MDIKEARVVIEQITMLADILSTTPGTLTELKILSEIQPSILADINAAESIFIGNAEEVVIPPSATESPSSTNSTSFSSTIKGWLDYNPDVEWKIVRSLSLMVSENGDIWDLTKHKILPKYFIDGDLRVILGDDPSQDARRAAPIVCRAFNIYSLDRDDEEYIIDYKNGDHRDLRVSNITWVKKPDTPMSRHQNLIEDICRRIIDHDGNIKEILSYYENSRPAVTEEMITNIISKKDYSDISDRFFMTNASGKIYPRTVPTNPQAVEGLDVAQFITISGDTKLSAELIKDKIKNGQKLSILEQNICVFTALDDLGPKIKDNTTIRNAVKKRFGIELPFELIADVMKDYTSELARVFGRVK